MEALIIEATPNTPKVTLNPAEKIFNITGESRPENVKDFYEPILKWFENYLAELKSQGNTKAFSLRLFLEYFNSSSAKYMLNLSKKMYEFIAAGIPVSIDWCFIEDDEDMKETGEEIERMTKVPFKYMVVE
ncbi:MAG: hypothetical protein A2275_04450 [Bacteroidetes bacterium RIFOXYA12_FULL_35_11]|nr:MAG: hypothetical protein A2X01_07770 [Bacteroidetes bacterium GWF2_35_48]OFY75561.1 MAG: hypothetical protein A2275_04450 [Bacteroidetes bacterium RIFOXYA12_FULL_35_11]HBX49803.1 nuclear pore complex subunit [Bacteroidales bacterium]